MDYEPATTLMRRSVARVRSDKELAARQARGVAKLAEEMFNVKM